MAVLAWAKEERVFIKVQEGIGDNLTREDRAEGYVDYVLWSTFRLEYLDIDQELEMECLDSGMVLSKSLVSAAETLPDCCRDAGLSSAEILLSD